MYYKMNPSKQQVLETISSISKIIMLAFKPVGTKIAIRNHVLVLCELDVNANGLPISYMGLYQGIERYCYGDSRDDLYILNDVLINFINMYVQYYPKDSEIYSSLIMMCKYVVCGLKRLQTTYVDGNATCVIQYMINILYAIINDSYRPYMMYSINRSNQHNLMMNRSDDRKESLEHSSIFDAKKIKDFWALDELKGIINQFDRCFDHEPEEISDDLDELEKKMENLTDRETLIEIKTVQINYDGLPRPKNPTNALVGGYLVGIQQILNAMDNRFIILLDRSVKGKK